MKEQRASWFELGIGGVSTIAAVRLLFTSARKLMSSAGSAGGVETFVVVGFFWYTVLILYLALRVAMKEGGE